MNLEFPRHQNHLKSHTEEKSLFPTKEAWAGVMLIVAEEIPGPRHKVTAPRGKQIFNRQSIKSWNFIYQLLISKFYFFFINNIKLDLLNVSDLTMKT